MHDYLGFYINKNVEMGINILVPTLDSLGFPLIVAKSISVIIASKCKCKCTLSNMFKSGSSKSVLE